jgi:hypothetical protein
MYGAHQQNLLPGSLRPVTKGRGWSRLRDPTGIPLLSSFHFTETVGVLWWTGTISHDGSALYFGTATMENNANCSSIYFNN